MFNPSLRMLWPLVKLERSWALPPDRLQSLLSPLIAMWPWVSYLTSLKTQCPSIKSGRKYGVEDGDDDDVYG